MNAPDRLGLTPILGSLTMSYAPLIDRERRTFGTRLTMLSVKPTDRLPVGLILEQLNGMWPESRALELDKAWMSEIAANSSSDSASICGL